MTQLLISISVAYWSQLENMTMIWNSIFFAIGIISGKAQGI